MSSLLSITLLSLHSIDVQNTYYCFRPHDHHNSDNEGIAVTMMQIDHNNQRSFVIVYFHVFEIDRAHGREGRAVKVRFHLLV